MVRKYGKRNYPRFMDKSMISFNYHSYFDQIYLINLKRRPDRLRDFFKNNNKHFSEKDIKIFEAIDGKNIEDQSWEYSKGALGCRLSHLEIFKNAVEENHKRILIIEDDAIIKNGFSKKLKYLINKIGNEWDMIYFGGTHNNAPIRNDQHILRLQCTLTTHCYALNIKCIPFLIEKIETDMRWVDCVIADQHAKLRVYGFQKPLAIQQKSYSDIIEDFANYNTSTFTRVKNYLSKSFEALISIAKNADK